ncbi:MAG: uracil-DNA glycosylase family protein [Vicinamibacterales bacterium]
MVASQSSRVLVIGQAPGRIAHETGVPWNDKSGERLREWLGVTDAQFYDESLFAIVPMGFCYPGKGKAGDKPPRPECATLWHHKILPTLTRIELTVYVGRYAFERSPMRLAAEAEDLTEGVRAACSLLPGRIVLPHPSPRNRHWITRNPWFERDVLPALRKRIGDILARGARHLPSPDLPARTRGVPHISERRRRTAPPPPG